MSDIIDFLNLAGQKANLKLLEQLHSTLLSTGKRIQTRIFPIYIRYADDEKNIALLYFKGKSLKPEEIELGLNIGKAKLPKGFENGKHMQYPGINCSIKLNSSYRLSKKLLEVIKLTQH